MAYTSHDPVNESGGEASVQEDKVKVAPIDLIKCLCKVNFEDGGFELFGFDRVKGFLSRTNCFMDLPVV